MNRRDLLHVAAGLGMCSAMAPRIGRAQATPLATPDANVLTAIQGDLHLRGPVPLAASATWGGVLPAGLTTLTAIVAIAGDDDTAAKLPSALVSALHEYDTRLAPRGTLVTNVSRASLTVSPGGTDDAGLFAFTIGERTVILTMVRAGRWVQVLTGPTTREADDAGADLIAVAASTMLHWGDLDGIDDPTTALPAPDDLPAGATVTMPPTVMHDLATA